MCSGAAFHVRKWTFHAPVGAFHAAGPRCLVILCYRPLSDTRRVVSVNSRGRGFLAGKAAGARRISAENETDGGAESFLDPNIFGAINKEHSSCATLLYHWDKNDILIAQ